MQQLYFMGGASKRSSDIELRTMIYFCENIYYINMSWIRIRFGFQGENSGSWI